ncbi:MAG: hypothetical protein JWO47_388 [Candidatus Saccharibacteria bacterium]|nr:hypothetical protein [Candidatus Saccharibacteria bacterium]
MGYMFKKKIAKTELVTYGMGLMQEFVSAVANQSVAAGLKQQAERDEILALQNIAAVGAHNNVYVTPNDIPPEQQAIIAKASVNAHLQKTQALQVAVYTDNQVLLAELQVKEKYRGLKVSIRVLIDEPWPIDTFWRDAHGRSHLNEHGPKKVSGYIEDIDLRKNFILIRPTRAFKMINNSIQIHRVYMVDPNEMKPLVGISFS